MDQKNIEKPQSGLNSQVGKDNKAGQEDDPNLPSELFRCDAASEFYKATFSLARIALKKAMQDIAATDGKLARAPTEQSYTALSLQVKKLAQDISVAAVTAQGEHRPLPTVVTDDGWDVDNDGLDPNDEISTGETKTYVQDVSDFEVAARVGLTAHATHFVIGLRELFARLMDGQVARPLNEWEKEKLVGEVNDLSAGLNVLAVCQWHGFHEEDTPK